MSGNVLLEDHAPMRENAGVSRQRVIGNAYQVWGVTVKACEHVIVDSVSFEIARGRTLGLVGQSGSGKSMLVKALLGLLPDGVHATGSFQLDDVFVELPGAAKQWKGIRGKRAVLLLQDPFTSLDPMRRCGDQIADSLLAHADEKLSRKQLRSVVIERLTEVGLPARVARLYPHQLSGGMRQRVAIAASLACDPDLLFADEPTTALDVTTQREILDLLEEIQLRRHMMVMLISHDLALVRERCDTILVMRDGQIVERGAASEVFNNPQHPYTKALRAASPTLDDVRTALEGQEDRPVLLRVAGLTKNFRDGEVRAVDDVAFELRDGECVGIVGESGSGKTTIARCLVGLEQADAGVIEYLPDGRLQPLGARDIQIVFQDPYSALNPALNIETMLAEALAVADAEDSDVKTPGDLLDLVGLPRQYLRRRPAKLSGGERQRVAIARALAPNPKILICDESVSALDVSVQAQVLDLLAEMQTKLGLTILFISHDLAVIAQITERIYVMRDGKVVDSGSTASLLANPHHEYTRELIAAVPSGDRDAYLSMKSVSL